ncbi:hypothetical protein F4818DRAFT_424582 [Hypoxylon cercidicola]|nr:hypothetical protein F4818DRAFT_424582 [Hypoxylon cercidicola]
MGPMAPHWNIDIDAPFSLFCWRKGEDPACFSAHSLKKPEEYGKWDLSIIVAHSADQLSQDLCHHYEIPSQFWSGNDHKVTHDFGVRRLSNGTCSTWVRFLCPFPTEVVSSEPEWLRSSLVLRSKPLATSNYNQVTLIFFQPPSFFLNIIKHLFWTKGDWEDALVDPYHLVNGAFKAWYQTVDQQAWKILELARNEEIIVFEQSSLPGPGELGPLEIDYRRIHHRAKDAIHLVEVLDAVILSLECAINEHTDMQRDMKRDAELIWKTEHDELRHRRETFRSTRLRLSSIDQRLRNVINLAFNIGTLRDSQVMREDSYVMKTLALVALIFVPVGTIATIFGSQFFGTGEVDLPDGSVQRSTYVTSQFWILWAVAIPATMLLLLGWAHWIKNTKLWRGGPRQKSPSNMV